MRKIYCMILLISLLTVPYVSAQVGGGIMGGQGSRGHMDDQINQPHRGGMLRGHEMTGDMMHHMGQMTRLMQQMRDLMAERSDAESTAMLSGLMQDMSEHFKDMSRIMRSGDASKKDMEELNQQNMKMQKKYEIMRWR